MLPAPRVPDGLTISPVPFRKQPDSEAPNVSYRITARPNASYRPPREWAYAKASETSDQRRRELAAFLLRYNWRRPHMSLKGKPPISRLRLTEDNLLRLYS